MKLAITADIHGNRPALEAVIKSAPRVDGWIFAGDVVGYYPDVNEVCSLLADLRAVVIRGNHDAYVTGELIPNEERRPLYRTDWTRDHLTPANIRWLRALPIEAAFSFGKNRLLVRHASPWDEETYLYPDSPRLKEIQLRKHEFLILGHSHHPMRVEAGDGLLINPGSVGQPRDYNPAASYAVLDLDSGVVEHRRAPYDVDSYQSYLRGLDWPESTVAILSRTR